MQLALTALLVIGFQHTSPDSARTYLQLKAIQYLVGTQRPADLAAREPDTTSSPVTNSPRVRRCFQRLGRPVAGCGS